MLRLWMTLALGVLVVVGSGIIASLARAQPQPAASDPMAVITAFEAARNRRDVDGALSYFSDNAVISQRNTTFAGKDDIRRYLEGYVTRPRYVVVTDRHVTGNRVIWTERMGALISQTGGGTQRGVSQPFSGTGTGLINGFTINVEAVVQDGKIQSLAYTFGGAPSPSDPTLDGREELPPLVGLGAVLAVLVAMLIVASTGIRRASPVASSLRGRMLQDLQGWASARN